MRYGTALIVLWYLLKYVLNYQAYPSKNEAMNRALVQKKGPKSSVFDVS